MPDLHTALEAAINARLEVARAAAALCGCHPPSPHWTFDDDENEGRIVIEDNPHPGVVYRLTRRWNRSYGDMFMARHIATNDPAQIVRDCEYHLKVLKRHAPSERPTGTSCDYCESLCHSRSGLGCESPDAPWPCDDINDLLDVYPEVTRDV